MTPAAFSGFVATVLATIMLAPQVTKLARTGDVTGLSAAWVGLGFSTNVAWTIYLARERLAFAAISTTIAAAFYGILWLQLRRNRMSLRSAARTTAFWTAGLVGVYLILGWSVFGLVMGFTYFIQVAPSLAAAYRERHPSGISPATWTITIAEGALWMHYGVWHQDVPIMVFSLAAMLSGLLMVARYLITRPTPEPAT